MLSLHQSREREDVPKKKVQCTSQGVGGELRIKEEPRNLCFGTKRDGKPDRVKQGGGRTA